MASPSEQEKIPKAEIVCAQIRKNWRALVDDLDPLDLLDIWLEKEIINTGDKQRIRNEITDQNKARKALEIITSRGGRTVLLFLESLKENWNHLSEKIVTTEVDTAKLPDAANADPYSGNWCFTIDEGVHESSLPVAHPGYQVLSDILFKLGVIANALTQCSS